MHYANGQEAKAGDLIYRPFSANSTDPELIGVLMSANASSNTCNGQVVPVAVRYKSDGGLSPWMPIAFGSGSTWYVTIGQLLPAGPIGALPESGG